MNQFPHRTVRPQWLHGGIAVAASLALGAAAIWMAGAEFTGYHLLAAWLVGLNPTTFVYYGYDKWCARRGGRRVPEVVLLGLALAGGSPSAFLAMHLFHHKTIKGGFRLVFWAIVVGQSILLIFVLYDVWRRRA